MLHVGALVQVKASALGDDINGYVNKEVTDEHGWLWVVVRISSSVRVLYECRSIATGHEADWFATEIEGAGDAANEEA